MQKYALLLTLITPLLASTPAAAWGDAGHEVVCEIAFQELNPTARARVRALMREDEAFALFSKSCSWMDHPQKRWVRPRPPSPRRHHRDLR